MLNLVPLAGEQVSDLEIKPLNLNLKSLKNTLQKKTQTNATNVTLHPLGQAIWGDIQKHTVEKSQTNATSVTMHDLIQVDKGHIYEKT